MHVNWNLKFLIKVWEKLEDAKGVIRSRKSKKGRRQHDQKKMTNNDLQNMT